MSKISGKELAAIIASAMLTTLIVTLGFIWLLSKLQNATLRIMVFVVGAPVVGMLLYAFLRRLLGRRK